MVLWIPDYSFRPELNPGKAVAGHSETFRVVARTEPGTTEARPNLDLPAHIIFQ